MGLTLIVAGASAGSWRHFFVVAGVRGEKLGLDFG